MLGQVDSNTVEARSTAQPKAKPCELVNVDVDALIMSSGTGVRTNFKVHKVDLGQNPFSFIMRDVIQVGHPHNTTNVNTPLLSRLDLYVRIPDEVQRKTMSDIDNWPTQHFSKLVDGVPRSFSNRVFGLARNVVSLRIDPAAMIVDDRNDKVEFSSDTVHHYCDIVIEAILWELPPGGGYDASRVGWTFKITQARIKDAVETQFEKDAQPTEEFIL